MALCFDCVMAVVEQVVNACTTRNCSWFTLFFVVIFFQERRCSLTLWGPLAFSFLVFCSERQSELQLGYRGDFQKPVVWFDTRGKPLQWRFYFSFVLACVIVGVVLSMSHCWLMSLKTRYPDFWPTHSVDSAAGPVWRNPHSGLSESTQSWP